MHARRIVPDEEGLVGLFGVVAIEEVDDLAEISSSTVFDRSSVSGPSSLHVWFVSVPSDEWHQSTGRGGVRQSRGLGIHCAGNLVEARDRRVLAWRSNALHRRDLLRSGKLTPCIASR